MELSAAQRARLRPPLVIGPRQFTSRVLQSPLAGVTDRAFRQLVRHYAPGSLLFTEMVSASGLHYSRTVPRIMDIDEGETPIGIQLFDCRPDFLVEAARIAADQGADVIDINMGCPVNKITKNGGGSSLLREPQTAARIVEAVAAAVPLPVTVKTRLGWNDAEINILDFARLMQESGAALITIHARTRAQGFEGSARWEWIGRVKEQLTIPVIANGDIFSIDAAIRCLEVTGADGLMCSRGTMGSPHLVGQIDHYLRTGERLPEPSAAERLKLARLHLELLHRYLGEQGVRRARKHMGWYVRDFAGAATIRAQLTRIETVEQGDALLVQAIAQLSENPPLLAAIC
ncbi:tRNA dihydrouridine synthase DusB [Gloeobacter kilaueensis]|uniref:tRNA-dihydrouridine synthase n=1 Tax=Gloeobacter kilaueensis (strain ATCC BAA-2537 / CCAP 1431/1 / ULC 316 / JS1) TaxID=1183438 RepID=U5QMR4_GLOK1|nr:tRNA dihydrouridine synthase DusB [Gloeobacter kilaueensis]AGY60211.1 dihydroorotate dehydrogenase 1B [Gloeobacter kilaueensis JS1]